MAYEAMFATLARNGFAQIHYVASSMIGMSFKVVGAKTSQDTQKLL
jgi:hypothetical protein